MSSNVRNYVAKHILQLGPSLTGCTLCIFQIESCREVIESHTYTRLDTNERQLHILPSYITFTRILKLCFSFQYVTTTSRGIDFTGVDHVVLFNFQCHPSEYVRGVGRTARGVRGVALTEF
ncbi:hypothetical protein HID58_049205 [Brassica napus]|uniref:Helicase C-terminal domain-containing protein n=1 Tax=Brassica napus TaxID=3708 RepID=A0ABQ8B4C4_BRANA|nr:hypothetical protein HID58_049205 [Brassica napus]